MLSLFSGLDVVVGIGVSVRVGVGPDVGVGVVVPKTGVPDTFAVVQEMNWGKVCVSVWWYMLVRNLAQRCLWRPCWDSNPGPTA